MSGAGQPFSRASLVLNEDGLARGVVIDGHELPNLKAARVIMLPGEIAVVAVEIYVSVVDTRTVQT